MRSDTFLWQPCVAMALALFGPATFLVAQEAADRQQTPPTVASPTGGERTTEDDAEIAALRDEVRALRGDVRRLIELLESRTGDKAERETLIPSNKAANTQKLKARKSSPRPERSGAQITMTYAVADLVVPIRKTVTVAVDQKATQTPSVAPARPDIESLKDLVTSTIAPTSWDINGGEGAIQEYRDNLSLVISQTPQIHEEISDLFSRLRWLAECQVALDARIITLDELAADRIVPQPSEQAQVLTAARAERLIELAQEDRRTSMLQMPKVTLFSGQTANLQTNAPPTGNLDLLVYAMFGRGSQSVRLRVAVNAKDKDDVLRSGDSLNVRAGQSLLLELPEKTDAAANRDAVTSPFMLGFSVRQSSRAHAGATNRRLLLLTPRIIEPEQEEELRLVTPAKP